MSRSGAPSLLVAINGNVPEWQATFTPSPERPRLPLPYAMGAACAAAGFRLQAIDSDATGSAGLAAQEPFDAIYGAGQLREALRSTDVALLWGTQAIRAIVRQLEMPPPRRRVIVLSYTWPQRGIPDAGRALRVRLVRAASSLARGVVLMTREQAAAARRDLRSGIPVIQLRVGIDTAFYRTPGAIEDVDPLLRDRVARFVERPYAIMPGDELRLNNDALRLVERTTLNLVRISQYGYKSGIEDFKAEVALRGLGDRILVLERISYRALRFLLQRAAVYAGLVDSRWQPAGWTVVCESLASGVPAVLYDGLAARELEALGVGRDLVRVVTVNDVDRFAAEAQALAAAGPVLREEARLFARAHLDLENTGAAFARDLRAAVMS